MPHLSHWMRANGMHARTRRNAEPGAEHDLPTADPIRDWDARPELGVDELKTRAEQWYATRGHTDLVLCGGDPSPIVLCVGEAPERAEIAARRPFVGPSGQLLAQMMRRTGTLALRPGEGALATNASIWLCHSGTTPSTTALAASRPWLCALIASARPRVLLALGATAARTLIGTRAGVARLRGRFHALDPALAQLCDTEAIPPVLATWHPAYVLRAGASAGDALASDLAALAHTLSL